jgi:hypothetical protein
MTKTRKMHDVLNQENPLILEIMVQTMKKQREKTITKTERRQI